MSDILLVDGNNICYKYVGYADYTLLPEQATKQVLKAARRYKTNCIIVGFDGGKSQFRSRLYPEYKAGRTDNFSTQEKLHRQEFYEAITEFQNALTKYGIKWLKISGVEFDDLAAYIVRYYGNVIIYSSDKDLLQLGVRQYSPFGEFKELSLPDCTTKEFILAKAIAGDTSDNIKGIKGIGIKTAVNIIHKYGFDDFEELLKHLDPSKKREREIIKNADLIRFNLELVDLGKYNREILGDNYKLIDEVIKNECQ